LWTENRWQRLMTLQRAAYLRDKALIHIQKASIPSWVWPFYCDEKTVKFSNDIMQGLNGTNSGVCALNLAYLMRPKMLYLFGFDMKRGPADKAYWHRPYEWAPDRGSTKDKKYEDWSRQFSIIAQQFKGIGTRVINVSGNTAVKAFEIKTPAQLGLSK
jgi:hypothetical protein